MKKSQMKNVPMIAAGIACAAFLAPGSVANAQAAIHQAAAPQKAKITAQQKAQERAASDQAMRAALASLQAASGAMQTGNAPQTAARLRSAIASMLHARAIYNGPRLRAIARAEDALKEVNAPVAKGRPGAGNLPSARLTTDVAKAIQNVQAALNGAH